MGAAGYVGKPFSQTELVARIRTALRRREMPEPSVPYAVGDLAIDWAECIVPLAGSPIRVTHIK